jgi:hypothetical protein
MHKLVHGIGDVDIECWFEKSVGTTDPLNVKSKNGTLELRRNFFTMRIA